MRSWEEGTQAEHPELKSRTENLGETEAGVQDTVPKGRDLHGEIPEACRGPPSRVPPEPVCAHPCRKGAEAGKEAFRAFQV